MQHPVNILIVDDMALYRTVLTDCLQRSGYLVTGTCGHDQQAIEEEIRKSSPALAFISFKTTQRSTLYTFEWMAQQYPHIRQAMMSLYPSGSVDREAKRLQVQGLIVKSFDMDTEIKALLQSIIP